MSLVCLAVATVDTTLVDSDVIVDITFDNIPAGNNADRITVGSTTAVNNTFIRILNFSFLLPLDVGVTYGCVSALQSVENSQFVHPVTFSTVPLTLDDIAGTGS